MFLTILLIFVYTLFVTLIFYLYTTRKILAQPFLFFLAIFSVIQGIIIRLVIWKGNYSYITWDEIQFIVRVWNGNYPSWLDITPFLNYQGGILPEIIFSALLNLFPASIEKLTDVIFLITILSLFWCFVKVWWYWFLSRAFFEPSDERKRILFVVFLVFADLSLENQLIVRPAIFGYNFFLLHIAVISYYLFRHKNAFNQEKNTNVDISAQMMDELYLIAIGGTFVLIYLSHFLSFIFLMVVYIIMIFTFAIFPKRTAQISVRFKKIPVFMVSIGGLLLAHFPLIYTTLYMNFGYDLLVNRFSLTVGFLRQNSLRLNMIVFFVGVIIFYGTLFLSNPVLRLKSSKIEKWTENIWKFIEVNIIRKYNGEPKQISQIFLLLLIIPISVIVVLFIVFYNQTLQRYGTSFVEIGLKLVIIHGWKLLVLALITRKIYFDLFLKKDRMTKEDLFNVFWIISFSVVILMSFIVNKPEEIGANMREVPNTFENVAYRIIVYLYPFISSMISDFFNSSKNNAKISKQMIFLFLTFFLLIFGSFISVSRTPDVYQLPYWATKNLPPD